MTENKRFEIKPSVMDNNKYVIHDSKKEYTFSVLDSTLNYMFCKALNEQHEQIERLKDNFRALDEVKCELADENEQLRKENDMLSCELSVSANKEISRNCRIAELEEENKELKQFKEDVFNKIDMHLRMLPIARDNEFNAEYGDPSLYTGAIYMLETLKKELSE